MLNTGFHCFLVFLCAVRPQALYDYQPSNSDELALVEGDAIEVISSAKDPGWSIGMLRWARSVYALYFKYVLGCMM